MKTAEWKKIRQRILERDRNICQYCDIQKTEHMQINHIDGDPKNHSDENLEVICSSCHKITHSGLWAEVFQILDVYENSNFNHNEIIQITGKMRDAGKSDDEIIQFLGLKNKISWKQDLDYLSSKFGFITSRPMNKSRKPVFLTETEQQDAIKNRKQW